MGLKLRHPNIVSVYEVNPDVRHPFMAIEFIEGQTLREMSRLQGRIDPLVTCKLMHGIAAGLAYAASLGISHRDMKLSNVLVSSGGTAKLVDFGLAALADRNNPEKIADCPNARAIDYAALERGTGVRKDDPRSDLFFAGAIMYQMLAGEPAMPDTRDRLQRLNISRFREIKPLHQLVEGLPVPAVQICQKALTLNPAERYQKASDMEADLKKAIARLEAGPTKVVGKDGAVPEVEEEEATFEGEGYVIMLVESKAALQDVVRARLKNRGYRVLVFSDPQRALARFDPLDDLPADCVVFGAAELGTAAVEAFNELGRHEHTADLPAILLVDRRQSHVISQAETSASRRLLPLPLKVRDLRTALAKLLAGKPRRGAGTL
jgi:serine/threonine-protein kinase